MTAKLGDTIITNKRLREAKKDKLKIGVVGNEPY